LERDAAMTISVSLDTAQWNVVMAGCRGAMEDRQPDYWRDRACAGAEQAAGAATGQWAATIITWSA
jgi:hypothetical protein